MLIQFALTDLCLAPIGDAANSRARLNEFRGLWRRAGLLVRPIGEANLSTLVEEAKRQQPPLRDLWLNALAENRQRVVQAPGWAPPLPNTRVDETMLNPAKLLLIHPEESPAWGWGTDQPIENLSNRSQVARFDCLPTSRLSRAADEAAAKSFEIGIATSRVRDHLRSCMAWANTVTVVDAYVGKEELERPTASGFGQFFSWLANERRIGGRQLTEIRLFTAFGMQRQIGRVGSGIVSLTDAVHALKSLRTRVPVSEVRDFALHSVDVSEFQRYGHDRYVRFDDIVIKIPGGMRVCSGTRVSQKTSMHLIEASYAASVEKGLEQCSTHSEQRL